MHLAERSGQPFLHLLRWHPRDVDTLWQIYENRAQAQAEQAREERFSAARQELNRRMGR